MQAARSIDTYLKLRFFLVLINGMVLSSHVRIHATTHGMSFRDLVQTTIGGVTMDSIIAINHTTFEVQRVFATDKSAADLIAERMQQEQSQMIPLTAPGFPSYNQEDTVV